MKNSMEQKASFRPTRGYLFFTLFLALVSLYFLHRPTEFLFILGPAGQFLLFKFTPLYNLNLLTKLYDDASWVKGEPKVLIMGSSHARYHIIPKEIARLNPHYAMKDIVNIGENAASPFEMYTAYRKQKQKFNHVELVYYTLEPHICQFAHISYSRPFEI